MISLEGIVHVVFRKSLLIASGVVGSPHAAKQRPDKFRRAISGSTSDTTGAAVPDTAPFGLLGGRDLMVSGSVRDIGIPISLAPASRDCTYREQTVVICSTPWIQMPKRRWSICSTGYSTPRIRRLLRSLRILSSEPRLHGARDTLSELAHRAHQLHLAHQSHIPSPAFL